MDNQVKDAEARIAALKKQLKEKEQENRISKLRLKELKRNQKHNQLTPLRSIELEKPKKTKPAEAKEIIIDKISTKDVDSKGEEKINENEVSDKLIDSSN